jgi:hypothetical protein
VDRCCAKSEQHAINTKAEILGKAALRNECIFDSPEAGWGHESACWQELSRKRAGLVSFSEKGVFPRHSALQ